MAGINLFKGNNGYLLDAKVLFPHLIMALNRLEVEITQLMRDDVDEDSFAPTVLMNPVMFITALRAECYWCLGERMMAISWAREFYLKAQSSFFRSIWAGVLVMYKFLLQICYESEEYLLLEQFLDLMEHHAVMCTTVRHLKDNYVHLLGEKMLQRPINNTNNHNNHHINLPFRDEKYNHPMSSVPEAPWDFSDDQHGDGAAQQPVHSLDRIHSFLAESDPFRAKESQPQSTHMPPSSPPSISESLNFQPPPQFHQQNTQQPQHHHQAAFPYDHRRTSLSRDTPTVL